MSAESFEAPSLEYLAELLPAYEFEAFIAQGGMGAVYKARQRSLDRDVAIKILPRELGADPEFRQSFETEAKAMARLNHPNLIGVYDFGDVEGMPYIVMEYVNGKSLFHSAYNTAIDPVQAVTIVKGICDGLAHAHENGVIHRDIKPANILLTPKAEPKIGDFGLARPAGTDSSGIVMGTPGYAAPEITRHPDHADRRSDLFALGVVLYELLIGRCPPYDYQPPPSTVTGCDPALDRICEKAMHPVADLRYPGAEAMSAALEEWLKKPAAGPAPALPAGRRMRRIGGAPATVYEAAPSGSGGMAKGLFMLAAAVVLAAVGWGKFKGAQAAHTAPSQAPAGGPVAAKSGSPPAAARPADSALVPAMPEKAGSSPRRKPAESSLASLARLKADLAEGKRAEMPAGSISFGSTTILVVPKPMGWHAAAAFAEEHGGHLFVVASEQDLDRLSALVPPGEDGADPGLWLGAGRAGREEWTSVDGSPWAAPHAPAGVGTYAILDAGGVVKAREAVDRYPFVIQWQGDGSNPALLPEVLRRTGESLAAGQAAFPPGTFEYGGNPVFIASARVTAAEAEEMASRAGGHLIALQDEEKDAWLADKLSFFTGDRGYWIGAVREDDQWKWSGGAPWSFTRWEDEQQAAGLGTRVKVEPGGAWRNAFRDDRAAGFIVEWSVSGSGGGMTGSGPQEIPLVLPPAIAELETKAKDLLAGHEKKRQAELLKNMKDFHWELDTWLGDLSRNEQEVWANHVNLLKAKAKDGRVPEKVTGIRLSERMAKIVEYCAGKQTSTDAAFKQEARKIRDAYLKRVKDAMGPASEEEKFALEHRIKASEDLDGWLVAINAGMAATVRAPDASFIIVSATFSARGKSADVTERVRKLVLEEQRPFRASLSDLGQDPDPGWRKSLTIKYSANGVEGQKSWGEDAEVDPVELMKEASAAGSAEPPSQGGSNPFGTPVPPSGKTDPLVGKWKWRGTQDIYTFSGDGTVETGRSSGRWKLLPPVDGKRVYELKWDDIVDKIAIGDDPDYFEGTNTKGHKIWARRVL